MDVGAEWQAEVRDAVCLPLSKTIRDQEMRFKHHEGSPLVRAS